MGMPTILETRSVVDRLRVFARIGPPPTPRDIERRLGEQDATRNALLYVVLPVWLGAGVLDWWHHRKTNIERTAGTHESLTHLLMLAEAGVASLSGLFFEVNSGVLLVGAGAFAAHEATAIWDVGYADRRRKVTPSEQHVHSYQHVVPLMALSLLAILNWDHVVALNPKSGKKPDFKLRPKRRPIRGVHLAGMIGAVGLLGVLPYLEEFWRCYRQDHTLAPHPAPEDALRPEPTDMPRS